MRVQYRSTSTYGSLYRTSDRFLEVALESNTYFGPRYELKGAGGRCAGAESSDWWRKERVAEI